MLSAQQRAARKYADKKKRIKWLCLRLDAAVMRAEKLKSGKTRKHFLQIAEEVREELRELDH